MPATDEALRVEIAGTVFEVSALDATSHAWGAARYAPFLSERPPDVHVTAAILDRTPDTDAGAPAVEADGTRVRLTMGAYRIEGDLASGRFEWLAPPLPTVLSPSPFRALCGLLLLRTGGVMLHAAGVADGGVARVFCGPSESGKTTVAGLAGARPILSDETVAIRPGPAGYRACATPFFGEAGPVPTQSNGDAPLSALFFLRKSTRFAHRRLERRDAVQRAFPQVFLPKRGPGVAEAILGILDAVTAIVPCFELEFAARAELWSYLDGIA